MVNHPFINSFQLSLSNSFLKFPTTGKTFFNIVCDFFKKLFFLRSQKCYLQHNADSFFKQGQNIQIPLPLHYTGLADPVLDKLAGHGRQSCENSLHLLWRATLWVNVHSLLAPQESASVTSKPRAGKEIPL